MKGNTIVNKAFSLLLTIIMSFSLISSGSAGTSISSGTAVSPGDNSDLVNQLRNVPDFKFKNHENGIGYGNCPVYTAPSEYAFRCANGKASCYTDAYMSEAGFDISGWLLVRYETNNGGTRVGYIPPKYVRGFKSVMSGCQHFEYIPVIAADTIRVTDNPLLPGSAFATLDQGETFYILAKYTYYGNWWYIECTVDGLMSRGFIDQGTSNFYLSDYYTNDRNLIPDECFYNIGIPDLHGRTYSLDDMSFAVYWVQVQLKATGIYYQGEIWDETGNLGDHTMQEIASFMQSRGYYNHNGCVDQHVINELAEYMGSQLKPVYVGGFYRHMDSIMNGNHTGSMQKISSNLVDMIPHMTVGGRWVQCCLAKLGYYSGPIDGKYGEKTEEAVYAFQKDYGFEQRNYVTLGVARSMLEVCHAKKCFLDDLP